MSKFTIFEEIDDLTKKYEKQINILTEAADEEADTPDDEQEMEGGEGEEQDPTMPPDEPVGPEGGESEDPNDYANPEEGVFVSDNQKAEFAKTLLSALMANPPETGTIPTELMNVSTQNADQVIGLIQNYVNMSNGTEDNEKIDSNMANDLKHAGN